MFWFRSYFLSISGLVAIALAQCIGGGDENTINQVFRDGGDGAVVQLCPGAVIGINGPIQFTANNQELSTEGYPTDGSRATIVINNGNPSGALIMGLYLSGIKLLNVIIDGNREGAGLLRGGGDANIVLGGRGSWGVVVQHIVSKNPRSWSCLQVLEWGPENLPFCSSAEISYNDIGPCGQGGIAGDDPAPWSDGISMSCTWSSIHHNNIYGATDGAIVLFGAPGTQVYSNSIIGSPTDRSSAGVVISDNYIQGGRMTNCGICLGNSLWWEPRSSYLRGWSQVTRNGIDGNVAFPLLVSGWGDGLSITDNYFATNPPSSFADVSQCNDPKYGYNGLNYILNNGWTQSYYPPKLYGDNNYLEWFNGLPTDPYRVSCAKPL